MLQVLSAIFKICLASLIAGAILSALNISAADLLSDIGLTPDDVFALLQRGAEWAIPKSCSRFNCRHTDLACGVSFQTTTQLNYPPAALAAIGNQRHLTRLPFHPSLMDV